MTGSHDHGAFSLGHLGHHHHHETESPPPRWSRVRRHAIAVLLLLAAVAASASVMVGAGTAVVVTRFGEPTRVFTEPGLHWKWPAPVESITTVDLRLHTTSSGLLDVGTRDGLRVLMQAYVAWQVPSDPEAIRRFLRSVSNRPEQAARQLQTFLGSALEVTAGTVDLASLINTVPARLKLDDVETQLRHRLEEQVAESYGVAVRQVGLERLTLPTETMTATIERLKAERETVAEERMAEGRRQASEITANAQRDASILEAKANQEAAETEAQSRVEAARIVGEAYRADPELYTLLRSLETLEKVIGANTRLILRSDAPPFRVLSDGPGGPPSPAPTAKGDKR